MFKQNKFESSPADCMQSDTVDKARQDQSTHRSSKAQQIMPDDLNAKYDWEVTNAFIERIVQELTMGCSLSFAIPKTRIPQIVEKVAKWWFRKAEVAVEERWYIVRNVDLTGTLNKILKLPEQIVSISDVRMLENDHTLSMKQAKFSLERLLASSSSFYTMTTGTYNYVGPNMLPRTGASEEFFMGLMEIGQLEAILYKSVMFDFNQASHKFTVLGDTQGSDIVLKCFVRVSLHDLFNDERFLNHCVGQCMKELSFILGTFSFKMPGNVSINFSEYARLGDELVQDAKQEVENDTAGDMFAVLTN